MPHKRPCRLGRRGRFWHSRVSYRLDHAGSAEVAGIEPARRRTALRRSRALPFHSAIPPEGRRGSRTPKALADPPVFETGYRAHGSPSKVTPAGVEPATSRLRVGCTAGLSYGAE